MSVEITTNADEFRRVMGLWLRNTSQELSKAINRRMFYLLLRAYVLTPPQNLDAERRKIREYMNVEPQPRRFDKKSGKLVGRKSGRVLRRVNLIAQFRNKREGMRGLYGDSMRKASARVFRKAIGSVGYLKAPIVLAIKEINGHFTQWGGKRSKKAKDVSPNGALVKIAAEYGINASVGNVAMMKGAKATARPASPGINPTAYAAMSLGTEQSIARIESLASPAMARAMEDEKQEMLDHIQDVVDDAADRACLTSPNGRAG